MKNVLVTGTSSGIGAATALHLHDLGMKVFAGVRDPSDADVLVTEVGPEIRPVTLDITSDSSVAAAVEAITAATGDDGLWAVVNNAGEAYPGPLEVLPLQQLHDQLEVNVVGQVRVAQAFLPLVRKAGGRLVFVGSIGGKTAFQFAGAYHASKFAMEAIADVLRQELDPDGLAVSLIEPGPISTGIWDKGVERIDEMLTDSAPALDRYRERLRSFRESLISGDDHGTQPERVAEVIGKALTVDRPSARYAVGLPARITSAVSGFIPSRVMDVVGRRLGG